MANWDDGIVTLQQEMNIAELIKEKARLEPDLYRADDDETSDRLDNIRDAIDKVICEDDHIIAVTKWGRPILDRAALDRLIEKLSDGDKTLVRGFVEGRYKWLCEVYEWYLAGTLVPRKPLDCTDVIAKLESHGIRIIWERGEDEDDDGGLFSIVNPTCTQCVWMHPVDGDPDGPIDYLQLIDDGKGGLRSKDAKEEDEHEELARQICADASRRLMEMMVGKAASGSSIELVPLLREIYGNELAVGTEALTLMSPGGSQKWMFLYLAGPVYEPRVIEEAEAA